MSNTILSTGKLLVGSTTREKSLTHRLPRGVFARDDEGNFQIADGITPGGHNPLKERTSKLSNGLAPYIDAFYNNALGYVRFRAVNFDEANRVAYIEYTTVDGQEVTVTTPDITNSYIVAFNMPSDGDLDKPLTLTVTDLDGNLAATRTFIPSEHFGYVAMYDRMAVFADTYKVRKVLPDAVDDIEFIEGASLVGRECAYLKSNGEYVGFLFTEVNDYTYTIPYNGREREAPKIITWPAEPGRVYYHTDLDMYSTHTDRIPVLSTLSDLTDARLDVYFRDGTLDVSYDLEERFSQYEAAYVTEQRTRLALVHLSDDYQHIAYLNGQFGVNYNLATLVPGDMTTQYFYNFDLEEEGDLVRNYGLSGGRLWLARVRADGSRATALMLSTAVAGEVYGNMPAITNGLATGHFSYVYLNSTLFQFIYYRNIDSAIAFPVVSEAIGAGGSLSVNGYHIDGTLFFNKTFGFEDYVAAANLPATVTAASAVLLSLENDVSGRVKVAKVQYTKSDGKTFVLNLVVHGGLLINLVPLNVDEISYESALLDSDSAEPLYPAKIMICQENKVLIYFTKDNAFELHRSFT